MHGVNRYRPSFSQRRLMNSVVNRFVNEMLDGSILPLLSYLANAGQLTNDEVRVIKEVMQRLASEPRAKDEKARRSLGRATLPRSR
jgi:predicted transcriptional regulator